jgi:hypothetical protein
MTSMWFYQSPSALTRTVGGEVLLASQEDERIGLLSGTAQTVWRLLESPRTLESVLDALVETYAVDRNVISDEVESLLRDLVARGWVEGVADGED